MGDVNSDNKPKMSFVKKITIAFVIAFFLLGLFMAGLVLGSTNPDVARVVHTLGQGTVFNRGAQSAYLSQDVDFKLYWELWDVIKEKYFDHEQVKDTELLYGSLSGMVAALGDPYSVFLNPQVNQEFTDELSGKFEGIGAEIGIRHEQLTVIAPLPGTPAERAGLRAGDTILAIDGFDTQGISLDKAVNMIRGEKGSMVKLIIGKPDGSQPEVEITRDTIDIVSVSLEEKEPGVAYIKLSYFNSDTYDDFRKIVNQVLSRQPRDIILDLRNNPGGFLDVAVKIGSAWIEDKPVVLEKLFDDTVTPFPSVGQPVFQGTKTYVLLNKGSASASEIVAGALQDYKLATIVGEQSFGKGSVQDLVDLSDGSSVKLTVAKWLTPNGNTIDEVGITPDISVTMTTEDYDNDRDPQLDKVMELIHNQ